MEDLLKFLFHVAVTLAFVWFASHHFALAMLILIFVLIARSK